MKQPKRPRSMQEILQTSLNTDRFLKLSRYANPVDDRGRYLHWDDLRFRTPPSDLSPDEWWLATRFARQSAAQKLSPFKDVQGRDFFYVETPELKSILRFIDMNAAGFLGSGAGGMSVTDGQHYLRRSLAEEPFASSLIEGAATTRDIAKKMIFENRPARTKDEKMVLNNYIGMEFAKSITHENLTVQYILELHARMTEGTLGRPQDEGRIRNKDDKVAVVDDSTGDILHLPPPAETLLKRLQALCDFANKPDDETSYCHPLIKAMALHFMLAYDHPFVDGNGRTARALFYWMMLKSGYWLMEYTSISSVIAFSPTEYYRSFLLTEADEGDATYFFLHQANVTKTALQRLHDYADTKRQEFQQFQGIISAQNQENPLNARQAALVQDFVLNRRKETTIQSHQKLHGISYLTARSDLENLSDRGLVKKTKQGRTLYFHPIRKISEKIKQA